MHLSDILANIRNFWENVFDIWRTLLVLKLEDLCFEQQFLGSWSKIGKISQILLCLGWHLSSARECDGDNVDMLPGTT